MEFETIILTVADGVASLMLNRPNRLNSFTARMHADVSVALDRIEGDATVRAMVLTGAGRAFCAGQDLAERTGPVSGEPVDLGRSVELRYAPLIRRLSDLRVPVIAAVNGAAAGAGANIALACDIVIAAERATFIQSFANIGLIPDSGGTWVLPRLIGQARALGLALTGEPLPAKRAEEWGMIWKCVADEALSETVAQLARKFANGPTLGFLRTKQLIRASMNKSLDEELEIERDTMRELGYSADYREGVAAFMSKRAAVFTGR